MQQISHEIHKKKKNYIALYLGIYFWYSLILMADLEKLASAATGHFQTMQKFANKNTTKQSEFKTFFEILDFVKNVIKFTVIYCN